MNKCDHVLDFHYFDYDKGSIYRCLECGFETTTSGTMEYRVEHAYQYYRDKIEERIKNDSCS
ncbi:MAG: hypothetical protein R3321_02340 [Nitrososphaeraceae archaeon]|nr:hypothetical protein [Nitrososphaeraceae archaeon]